MGCNVHVIQKKIVVYNTRNKNLKWLAYFCMTQNFIIYFRNETQNLAKFTPFEKFISI
jgi:hypothetical protein